MFGACYLANFSYIFTGPTRWGSHFGSRFGGYNGLFLAILAECVSSFVRLTTLILLPRCLLKKTLVSVSPRVIHLTLCLDLFQVLADALRVNKTIKEINFRANRIGDEGVKVWCPQRGEFGGPSRASRSNGIFSVVPQFVTVMRYVGVLTGLQQPKD